MKLTDDKIVCLVEMAQIVSNNKLTEQQNQDKRKSLKGRSPVIAVRKKPYV